MKVFVVLALLRSTLAATAVRSKRRSDVKTKVRKKQALTGLGALIAARPVTTSWIVEFITVKNHATLRNRSRPTVRVPLTLSLIVPVARLDYSTSRMGNAQSAPIQFRVAENNVVGHCRAVMAVCKFVTPVSAHPVASKWSHLAAAVAIPST